MVIPQTAEYALRALGLMASLGQDVSMRTKDLAERAQIPPHYLSKIMRRLVAAKLLTSEKGHGGGFRFAKPMHRIRFFDILDAVGFEMEPNHCVFGHSRCNPRAPCVLHPMFSELNSAVVEWASRTTLQDVADGTAAVHFDAARSGR